jgi:hypothetical protein
VGRLGGVVRVWRLEAGGVGFGIALEKELSSRDWKQYLQSKHFS